MGTRRARTALVLALAVTAAVVTAGVGAGVSAEHPRQTPQTERLGATQVDADTVLLEADLRADGSAAWTIEYLVRLEDQNDTDAFDDLAADIESNRSQYTGRFADRIGRTVASAENSTGRSMAVENVSVRTSRQDIGREYGVVTYTFRWTGFATTNETAIAAGDALSGFYIDGDTRLTMTWSDNYRRSTVSPAPAERTGTSATWTGPLDFGSGGPTVVVREGSVQPPDAGGSDTGLVVGGLAILALVAVLAVLAYRRGLFGGEDASSDGPADVSADAADATDDSGAAGGAAAGGDDPDDGPPEELLSNEERVLRLLEEEGGRIKQQAVAQRLDWTDAKTSQVVTSLAEDDELEKFRIGRENVLALPEESDL